MKKKIIAIIIFSIMVFIMQISAMWIPKDFERNVFEDLTVIPAEEEGKQPNLYLSSALFKRFMFKYDSNSGEIFEYKGEYR